MTHAPRTASGSAPAGPDPRAPHRGDPYTENPHGGEPCTPGPRGADRRSRARRPGPQDTRPLAPGLPHPDPAPVTAPGAVAGHGGAPDVEIAIDEIVLRGVHRYEAASVVAALELALGSLARSDPAALAALTDVSAAVVRPPAPRAHPARAPGRGTGPGEAAAVSGPAALGAAAAAGVWAAVGGAR